MIFREFSVTKFCIVFLATKQGHVRLNITHVESILFKLGLILFRLGLILFILDRPISHEIL